ncbi:MAG: 16S rRNA (adenine(1518)-N(6)/adenine(1519)-N(6))-dimethyltransferase RsmA [SAR324 cluster bacterium]|nr:16S rRNA (adenine(1518)-N(6)/adenine(1519)-N(6))-dimethyltransferase RsmA [SAR324 cluster bacterium]
MARKWGQHFLKRPSVAERILETAGAEAGIPVWEIGPGPGMLTAALRERGARVLAVEVDPELAAELRERFRGDEGFRLIEGDVLALSLDVLEEWESGPWKVVANLPYNISTPLFFRMLAERRRWQSLTLMVQWEVAERLCAGPDDGKAYGVLALAAELGFERRIAFKVPPEAFQPPPKVESAVVHLVPVESGLSNEEETQFLGWIRCLFQQRRKTLFRNLKRCSPEWVQQAGAALQDTVKMRRPEDLSYAEWRELFAWYCAENSPQRPQRSQRKKRTQSSVSSVVD